MELSNGLLPDGTRYIGEAPLVKRREQQESRGADQGYGLGLKIDRTSGTSMVHHGALCTVSFLTFFGCQNTTSAR